MYNEEITDEEVKEVARFVQANTFIEKLPKQYETEVVERGAKIFKRSTTINCFC